MIVATTGLHLTVDLVRMCDSKSAMTKTQSPPTNLTHIIVHLANGRFKKKRIDSEFWQYYSKHGRQSRQCKDCRNPECDSLPLPPLVMTTPGEKNPITSCKKIAKTRRKLSITNGTSNSQNPSKKQRVKDTSSSKSSPEPISEPIVLESLRDRPPCSTPLLILEKLKIDDYVSEVGKTQPPPTHEQRRTFTDVLSSWTIKAPYVSGKPGGTKLGDVITDNSATELPSKHERGCVPRRLSVRATDISEWVEPEHGGLLELSKLLDQYYQSGSYADRQAVYEFMNIAEQSSEDRPPLVEITDNIF